MRALLADAAILAGLIIITVAVYGAIRMPDIYTRLHAASKAAFLGVSGVLAAVAITGPPSSVTRALLTIGLLALTTPVAAHAIAHATHRRAGGKRRAAGAADARRSPGLVSSRPRGR